MRTDLALEWHEYHRGAGKINGVESNVYHRGAITVTEIEVTGDEGAKRLGKPIGIYYTVENDNFSDMPTDSEDITQIIAGILEKLLPDKGGILVVGLGNEDITPDALGPFCAKKILATRHFDKSIINDLSMPDLREVSVLSPGVMGQTGIEVSETVKSVCDYIKPAAVIAIDALACAGIKRVGKTVQIGNAGIEPGSGVGNKRKILNESTLGIPVIAVGVPTVADAESVVYDICEKNDCDMKLNESFAHMMLTPKDIDIMIKNASSLLGIAINRGLQKNWRIGDLMNLMVP